MYDTERGRESIDQDFTDSQTKPNVPNIQTKEH